MLKDLVIANDLPRERIKYLLMSITQNLGGGEIIEETKDEIRCWIIKDSLHIFDVRVSGKISEFYLRIQGKNELMFLKKQGFEGLTTILGQFPDLPNKLIVSKIKPSKTIHILMSGEGDSGGFPTIHIIWGESDWVAMTDYCKIGPDVDICKLLSALVDEAKYLWELAFGED